MRLLRRILFAEAKKHRRLRTSAGRPIGLALARESGINYVQISRILKLNRSVRPESAPEAPWYPEVSTLEQFAKWQGFEGPKRFNELWDFARDLPEPPPSPKQQYKRKARS